MGICNHFHCTDSSDVLPCETVHMETEHLTSDPFHLQIRVCLETCVDRHLLQHLRNTDDCPDTRCSYTCITQRLRLHGRKYNSHKWSVTQLADPSAGWLWVISLMSLEYHGNSNQCFPCYVPQETADGNMGASLILKQTTVGNVWTLHELWFVKTVQGIVEISSDIVEHK